MGTYQAIEHISLDGVIQAPGAPNEDGDYPYGGWILPYRDPAAGKAVLAAHSEHSTCCLAAARTISGRASGRRSRAVRSRTA